MTENKGPAGEVWLVGAGCGRGLLTWEGRETLARAHTVLYDALVPLDGLREVNPRAEWLPVGKRSGRHSMDQESINGLLIRKAREGKMVAWRSRRRVFPGMWCPASVLPSPCRNISGFR